MSLGGDLETSPELWAQLTCVGTGDLGQRRDWGIPYSDQLGADKGSIETGGRGEAPGCWNIIRSLIDISSLARPGQVEWNIGDLLINWKSGNK